MGLFSNSDGKGKGSSEIKGSCKRNGCDAKVSGRTGREAGEAAMKHAGDKHGDKHLGFRWGK